MENKNNLTNSTNTNSQPPFNESVIAKVKVTQNGEIFLNEKKVTLDEIEQAFIQLKKENGVVWYYRENPQDEPSVEAMQVTQAIIKNKLPVKLSSKPDYSDAVGLDGK